MVHVYRQLSDIKKLKKFKLNQETCGRGRKVQWHIVGELTFSGDAFIEYFVASSESKEELLVWADMNNMKIEELQ